jgi:hypothetical protein
MIANADDALSSFLFFLSRELERSGDFCILASGEMKKFSDLASLFRAFIKYNYKTNSKVIEAL